MTITLSKVLVLAAVIIFAIVAFVGYAIDTTNLTHLVAGIALGLAVFAAASLVP